MANIKDFRVCFFSGKTEFIVGHKDGSAVYSSCYDDSRDHYRIRSWSECAYVLGSDNSFLASNAKDYQRWLNDNINNLDKLKELTS